MGKRFLSFLCVLFFSVFVFAEVQIPQDKRVKNFPSGCCVWCAVENLGNIHGINQLKGIAQYRHDNYGRVLSYVQGGLTFDSWGNLIQTEGYWVESNDAPGTPKRVHDEFKRIGVEKYKLQEQDDLSMDIIEEAIKKDLGCAIGVKDYPGPGNYHMITLTDLTDKECVFVDNNGKCERFVKSREWFHQHWTGYTILVYPNPVKLERIKEKPTLR